MSNNSEPVILDQLILTLLIPKSRPDADAGAARRVLASARFRTLITATIARRMARLSAVAAVTVDLSA